MKDGYVRRMCSVTEKEYGKEYVSPENRDETLKIMHVKEASKGPFSKEEVKCKSASRRQRRRRGEIVGICRMSE